MSDEIQQAIEVASILQREISNNRNGAFRNGYYFKMFNNYANKILTLLSAAEKKHLCPQCKGEPIADAEPEDFCGHKIDLQCSGCGGEGTMVAYLQKRLDDAEHRNRRIICLYCRREFDTTVIDSETIAGHITSCKLNPLFRCIADQQQLIEQLAKYVKEIIPEGINGKKRWRIRLLAAVEKAKQNSPPVSDKQA